MATPPKGTRTHMHTIIHPTSPARPRPAAPAASFRQPYYDCKELTQAVKLTVYVPGVEAAGVEIVPHGPDLVVTARKQHVVRVNWQALHLESAQRDYQLRLRLGDRLNYAALQAELHDGVLTLQLPKKQPDAAVRPRRVA